MSREHRRPVMGRKGIGNLASFGICKKIEVWSAGGGGRERRKLHHIPLSVGGNVIPASGGAGAGAGGAARGPSQIYYLANNF